MHACLGRKGVGCRAITRHARARARGAREAWLGALAVCTIFPELAVPPRRHPLFGAQAQPLGVWRVCEPCTIFLGNQWSSFVCKDNLHS